MGWAYDPNAGGQQMVQMLDKGQHPQQGGVAFNFFRHSQDNAAIALASSRFDEALRNGWIVHDGHEGLRSHALNAVRRGLGGEKWRYDRPADAKGERRRKFPNDALIGAAMGHSVAVAEHEKPNNKVRLVKQREEPGEDYVIRRGGLTLRGEHHIDRDSPEGRARFGRDY